MSQIFLKFKKEKGDFSKNKKYFSKTELTTIEVKTLISIIKNIKK